LTFLIEKQRSEILIYPFTHKILEQYRAKQTIMNNNYGALSLATKQYELILGMSFCNSRLMFEVF